MSFYVYVIKSEVNGKLYTGHTKNLKKRLNEHNAGRTKSIKPNIPYKVIYTEQFESRIEAVRREKYLKSGVGREFLRETL